MALAARFRELDPGLDDFLFATIGEEENGMRLSVASALARRGMDPWTEANRLARLPRAKATEALAALIAVMPFARWNASEVPRIAARLSQLLPSSTAVETAPGGRSAVRGATGHQRLVWLLYAGLVAASLYSLIADRHSSGQIYGSPAAVHGAVSP